MYPQAKMLIAATLDFRCTSFLFMYIFRVNVIKALKKYFFFRFMPRR